MGIESVESSGEKFLSGQEISELIKRVYMHPSDEVLVKGAQMIADIRPALEGMFSRESLERSPQYHAVASSNPRSELGDTNTDSQLQEVALEITKQLQPILALLKNNQISFLSPMK